MGRFICTCRYVRYSSTLVAITFGNQLASARLFDALFDCIPPGTYIIWSPAGRVSPAGKELLYTRPYGSLCGRDPGRCSRAGVVVGRAPRART